MRFLLLDFGKENNREGEKNKYMRRRSLHESFLFSGTKVRKEITSRLHKKMSPDYFMYT